MKQYSPILFLFFLFIILSCKNNERISPIKDESAIDSIINYYILQSNNISLNQTERLKFSNIGYRLGLGTKNDTLKYKVLYNKIQTDLYYSQDSLEYYLDKLKYLADKTKSKSYLGGYYYQKASFYSKINIDSSFINYEHSKVEYLKAKENLWAGYSMLMMAEIQRMSADYFGVESTATAAIQTLENTGNDAYLSSAYIYLGMAYKELFNYEAALKSYDEAYKKADNEISKNAIINNIAIVHIDNKNYPKAIEILTILTQKKDINASLELKAKAMDNLGYSYFLSDDPKGLEYMQKALKIKDSIDDDFGLLASFLHLSEYYLAKNPKTSREYAKKAYSLSEKLKNTDDKLDAIEFIAKTTESKKESDELFREYTKLNDSIKIVRQQAKNQFAKIRYDSKNAEEESLKYQAENAENKLKAEKAKRRNELLLLTISFIILTVILFYRLLKSRHEKEKFQEAYKTETRIAKKVHDELANDVYNVMTFATTQNLEKPEKREILINSLDSVYLRTRDISRENSPIELGENFPDQLKDMISEYQTELLNVLIKDIYSIEWMKIDDNKKLVTYRVIQELMVNMKKHSDATLAVIAFSNLDKKVQIQYSDNGVGIKQGKTFFKNGLQNVENRIESIRGSLIFDLQTNRGVKLFFTYPV